MRTCIYGQAGGPGCRGLSFETNSCNDFVSYCSILNHVAIIYCKTLLSILLIYHLYYSCANIGHLGAHGLFAALHARKDLEREPVNVL